MRGLGIDPAWILRVPQLCGKASQPWNARDFLAISHHGPVDRCCTSIQKASVLYVFAAVRFCELPMILAGRDSVVARCFVAERILELELWPETC